MAMLEQYTVVICIFQVSGFNEVNNVISTNTEQYAMCGWFMILKIDFMPCSHN